MSKLVLIDGNAFMHRAFHALPQTLRLPDGKLINAVYGFGSFLINVLKTENPDYIAITFDHKKKTLRHEQYPEYKAGRVKAPTEFYEQIPLIKELIDSFNIKTFEVEGYESDDLIATLTRKFHEKNDGKIIVYTGDHDLLQLVNDNISVAMPISGLNKVTYYDTAKIAEKYGLTPIQIIDYKALSGDPSDNIPGVMGVGKKTATSLLKEFGTLENIYENLDKIKGKVKDHLKSDKESAFMSKKLATLIFGIDVSDNISDLETSHIDYKKAEEKFENLRFFSLMERIRPLEKVAVMKVAQDKQISMF